MMALATARVALAALGARISLSRPHAARAPLVLRAAPPSPPRPGAAAVRQRAPALQLTARCAAPRRLVAGECGHTTGGRRRRGDVRKGRLLPAQAPAEPTISDPHACLCCPDLLLRSARRRRLVLRDQPAAVEGHAGREGGGGAQGAEATSTGAAGDQRARQVRVHALSKGALEPVAARPAMTPCACADASARLQPILYDYQRELCAQRRQGRAERQ